MSSVVPSSATRATHLTFTSVSPNHVNQTRTLPREAGQRTATIDWKSCETQEATEDQLFTSSRTHIAFLL